MTGGGYVGCAACGGAAFCTARPVVVTTTRPLTRSPKKTRFICLPLLITPIPRLWQREHVQRVVATRRCQFCLLDQSGRGAPFSGQHGDVLLAVHRVCDRRALHRSADRGFP